MVVAVHRGTHEVGGSCVELRAEGKSLLLDIGLPLSAKGPENVALPDVPGLADGSNPNLLGIVISHPHQDHYGLLGKVHRSVPVFIGRQARNLLDAAAWFTRSRLNLRRAVHYEDGRVFQVGPFSVLPTLNDHSAFDSYSLLVEAEGKSVFYTGDFRMHGRKPGWIGRVLSRLPDRLNVLIVEGTCVGRFERGRPEPERELEGRVLASMRETRGLVLAWFSGQNMDRFATFFRAARRAGRQFAVDLYLARILDALNLASLPSPRGEDLRVYLPLKTKERIKAERTFHLVQPYYHRRIYPEDLAGCAPELVMMFRPSMRDDLEMAGCLVGAKLIYSLWHGYLEREADSTERWCRERGVGFEELHTSGHASESDLKRFIRRLNPRSVVPVHSFAPERFRRFCDNVTIARDGVGIEV